MPNVVDFFFFKQKTAYEMRISDWSSDVCSSDLFDQHENVGRSRQPLDIGVLHRPHEIFGAQVHHPFAEQHLRADAVDHVIAQVLGLQPVEAPLALERAACLRLAADAGDGAGEILAPGHALGAQHRVDAVDREFDVNKRSEEHTSELQALMRTSYAVV